MYMICLEMLSEILPSLILELSCKSEVLHADGTASALNDYYLCGTKFLEMF
jgi:hypothetical protein